LWTSATIDAALPAGTNGIGKLTANSGVDIGDVDVTSAIISSGTITTVTTVTNLTGGTTAADAAAAAINPVLTGCYASAAAPADMSADND
ncbi:hypothetical protein, partial [Bacillus cereus group sp. BC257]|uniref:hypothetical protein n=1 Tax=Bacillus cereus group sp. BC257 TaxID=3445326 RepID=UPI003F276A29